MRFIKVIFTIILTCFSFYYTNEIINYTKNIDPIMVKLKENSKSFETAAVNAEIIDNTITSGIVGEKVDVNSSYSKMKSLGEYNESLITFIKEYPKITIEDNYDKFVISGNENERKISFIFLLKDNSYLKETLKILKGNNIKSYFFVDGKYIEENKDDIEMILAYENYISSYGYDNIFNDKTIKKANKLVKKYTKNKLFCFSDEYDYKILSSCMENNINTIKEEIANKNNPYSYVKSNLKNGKIFVFEVNKILSTELNTIFKYIKQKGYDVIPLNELLYV